MKKIDDLEIWKYENWIAHFANGTFIFRTNETLDCSISPYKN